MANGCSAWGKMILEFNPLECLQHPLCGGARGAAFGIAGIDTRQFCALLGQRFPGQIVTQG